jgi:hypothetical protein
MQFVQDLRDVDRAYLLGQHPHRTEGARLPHVQLTLLRGVHHDGNGRRLRIPLDRLHRLQPIHAGHEMVHENRVGPVVIQILDGLLGRLRHVDFDVVLLEHAAQDDACRLRVVDD